MAEEKKEVKAEEEKKEEEPKVEYAYKVSYLSNGFYTFDGIELEAGKGPSIDQQHIMLDLSSLGPKVTHDIAVNDAVRQMITLMQQASAKNAEQSEPADAK